MKEPLLSVITVASHIGGDMHYLLESSRTLRLDIIVLGLGATYRGFATKLLLSYDYLRKCQPHNIVMFVDAYDTVILTDPSTLLKRYHQFGHPVVFSAEKNCWPDENLASLYPESETEYRYLNAGCWIGQAGYFANLCEHWRIPELDDAEDDQRWFATILLESPGSILLDNHCVLFQCLLLAQDDILFVNPVFNIATGTTPCVLHGNGAVGLGQAPTVLDIKK